MKLVQSKKSLWVRRIFLLLLICYGRYSPNKYIVRVTSPIRTVHTRFAWRLYFEALKRIKNEGDEWLEKLLDLGYIKGAWQEWEYC